MNEEMTGKWLRQVEHIRGHLVHRYSRTVNQVIYLSVFSFNITIWCRTWFCIDLFGGRELVKVIVSFLVGDTVIWLLLW